MRALPTLVTLLILGAPLASGAVIEKPLPEGWTGPSNLAFDDEGTLWLTLDGTWAIARWNLETNETRVYPLDVPKREGLDTMGALRFAPDGTIWTASQTHIHHLEPATGVYTTYELPTWGYLPGDILLAPDGRVWLAMVDKNRLVELDPKTERLTEHMIPDPYGGPVEFEETNDTTLLTITYANTIADFDPSTGDVALRPAFLEGPVGLAHSQDAVWIAEMSTSGITRLAPNGTSARFPTSGSAYYGFTGPSGILVHPDGSVWFAEHFADRIARLDTQRLYLHEYEVPSAPGTDTQRVALGPEGDVWFAEFSADKIGRANYTKEPVVIHAPFNTTLHAGGETTIDAHTIRPLAAFSPDDNLAVHVRNVSSVRSATTWEVTLAANESLVPGTYHVLLNVPDLKDPRIKTGYYLKVHVQPAPPRDVPLPVVTPVVGLLLAVLIWRRRAWPAAPRACG